jgi:hypothetical protein
MPVGWAIAIVLAPAVVLACCTCGVLGAATAMGLNAMNLLHV